jgi:Flp pilus assembly protein TadB
MLEAFSGLGVLSAMITPAVLILACGTLIGSTATRLARIVDRVRELSRTFEQLSTADNVEFVEERRAEVERQLASHARRSRLIQGSLTSFYIALALFVATSISLAVVALAPSLAWLPSALGLVGTLIFFHGCVLLIQETRLALSAVRSEMEFVLGLRERHQSRRNPR